MSSPLHVLLVEADDHEAAVFADALAESRIAVTRKSELEEGLRVAASRPFDAILLDTLPSTAGLEVVELAAKALANVPIIILTAEHDDDAAAAAVHCGAQDYLVKDRVDGEIINRAIRYSIQRKQAQEALRQAHNDLERKVRLRTAELQHAIDSLHQEAMQRVEAETRRRQAEGEVLEAVESEQRRIGRDLHDSIQGSLVGVRMMLEALRQRVYKSGGRLDREFTAVQRILNDTVSQTRCLAKSLCPVDMKGDGLIRALEQLTDTTRLVFRISCEFRYDDAVRIDDEHMAAHLYYIAREAVSNAVKHASAGLIAIRLCDGGRVSLTVQDDGVGLPPDRTEGMGFRTMRYRAERIGSQLEITSNEKGTVVTVMCPPPAARNS